MQQTNRSYIGWWGMYTKHVQAVILKDETDCRAEVSYWRNAVFSKILTYLSPLGLIALIPSVIISFMTGLVVIGFADLLAFAIVVFITVSPGIKLEVRKAVFIAVLFFLSVTLLYFLPLPGPALLFALSVTIVASLIYSSAAAYFSAWANTFLCLCFALLIYFEIDSPIYFAYELGAWIAISSNLVFLSFALCKCLDLLLDGLTTSLQKNKISEEKLERANRLYQFISQINQTIVHVKDAETLYQKSCDIALACGKYKMAWLGRFDLAQRKIGLLDSSGIPSQDLELFTDIPLEDNGPEDHVLRTGEYYLCKDVRDAYEIKDWKLYAKKHNINSFIILPIKKSGHIFGTFNLYATELNYFDDDDIAVLVEVTGDISFALDMFDKAERHKKAEIALQENFAKLEAVSKEQSAILNTLPASIALLDSEGRILKVNNEWIQFGRANGLNDSYQHVGKSYIQISEKSSGIEAEKGRQMALKLKEVLSGDREYFTMEYACNAPNENRWYKAEVRPFKSQHQTGAVVMHINITERKLAEAEMLLLINNTEESFILLNTDLEIVSFNSPFKKFYKEYSGSDIQKGTSILDYNQPERKEVVASIYRKVLSGSIEESEITTIGSNGSTSYFSLKYSPARDESGNIFGVFVTTINITEGKKAEQQKEFERRDKEALINSTDDLIWSISKEYKLIAANNAFVKEIKGYTGVEIKPGDDVLSFHLIPNVALNHWKSLYFRALLGESFKTEVYNPPSTGRNASWLEASFSPIIINEQIAGIACYSRNITERKIAEEKLVLTSTALQNALNDLNKIMDSSLDIICTVDAAGNFSKVSAASKSVWGFEPEELIGIPLVSFVYDEDQKHTQSALENVISGGKGSYFESRYICKDGSLLPVEWAIRWDAKNRIRYCVARDVSEKKKLEIALEKERQRFLDLFSEAPLSMGVLSGPYHQFEFVNPLYLKLIGKHDIIGKTVKEVLPEAVDQGIIKLLDEVYRTGNTFSTQEMLLKLDTKGTGQLVDKYLNFMYQAHRTANDIIDGILFFAVDVTEQVVLRHKIEENEAKLKEAQDMLQISNWEVDLTTNTSTWSDEFYKILGLNREETIPSPQTFLSTIHPDDFEFAKSMLDKTSHTFKADSFSARINHSNGSIVYVYAEWKFEFNDNNKPIRLYGILQDISERKTAELERAKITKDLLQRNRELEQFTFIVSHNLRAPTANIIGFTEYLQDENITEEERKLLLHGLASSTSGLDTVIKDINEILQVKLDVNEKKELICFSKLASEISASFENLIDEHRFQIKSDFSEVDEIFSIKAYLHSIFYNLISNSIKYSKPGEPPLIEISSKQENGQIILTFKDNGLGIDLKTKGDKVFGLYARFHSHVEGKGMGLYMVKTQVEAIGGKISIASEPNVGTVFTIIFNN